MESSHFRTQTYSDRHDYYSWWPIPSGRQSEYPSLWGETKSHREELGRQAPSKGQGVVKLTSRATSRQVSTERKGSHPFEEHWQSSLVAALPAVSWQSYSVLYNMEYYISTTSGKLWKCLKVGIFYLLYSAQNFESIKMIWKAESD